MLSLLDDLSVGWELRLAGLTGGQPLLPLSWIFELENKICIIAQKMIVSAHGT